MVCSFCHGSRAAYRMVASNVYRPSSTVSRNFSETTGPTSIKFHMQSPGKEGNKVYIFGVGHMVKIAAMPIHGKNPKKNLLQNHWVDCLET